MAAAKFTKPAAKTATPKKKVSRYAGIKASAPRDPMPVVGTYRFKWVSCEEGFNPGKGSSSFKVHLEIVSIDAGGEDHQVGQTVFFVQDEFDAFAGEEGEFLEAVTGEANEYSTDGQPLIGRLVDCQVTRGNARDDGDYYREFAWAVVADEDGQEVPRCGE